MNTQPIDRYRERHVIDPTVDWLAPVRLGTVRLCAHCGLRVIPRRGGWRHDPDAVRAAARVAP